MLIGNLPYVGNPNEDDILVYSKDGSHLLKISYKELVARLGGGKGLQWWKETEHKIHNMEDLTVGPKGDAWAYVNFDSQIYLCGAANNLDAYSITIVKKNLNSVIGGSGYWQYWNDPTYDRSLCNTSNNKYPFMWPLWVSPNKEDVEYYVSAGTNTVIPCRSEAEAWVYIEEYLPDVPASNNTGIPELDALPTIQVIDGVLFDEWREQGYICYIKVQYFELGGLREATDTYEYNGVLYYINKGPTPYEISRLTYRSDETSKVSFTVDIKDYNGQDWEDIPLPTAISKGSQSYQSTWLNHHFTDLRRWDMSPKADDLMAYGNMPHILGWMTYAIDPDPNTDDGTGLLYPKGMGTAAGTKGADGLHDAIFGSANVDIDNYFYETAIDTGATEDDPYIFYGGYTKQDNDTGGTPPFRVTKIGEVYAKSYHDEEGNEIKSPVIKKFVTSGTKICSINDIDIFAPGGSGSDVKTSQLYPDGYDAEHDTVTRPTSANYNTDNFLTWFIGKYNITGGPPVDSMVLHIPWDNGTTNGLASQLAFQNGSGAQLHIRGQATNGTWSSWYKIPRAEVSGSTPFGANQVLASNGSQQIKTTGISITQLEYLSNVTGDIQDQLNSKNKVVITPQYSTGTVIAEIVTNDGTPEYLYAPSGGGGTGSQIIVGTSAPTDQVGSDGDLYFQKTTGYTYKYLKFEISAIKGTNGYTQLSELRMVDSNNDIFDWTLANIMSNKRHSAWNAPPAYILDGSVDTKACMVGTPSANDPTYFIIKPDVPIDISTYTKMQIYTADDTEARDPADFKLYVSNDRTTWTEVLSATGVAMPSTRKVLGYEGNVTLPQTSDVIVTKIFVKNSGHWIPFTN